MFCQIGCPRSANYLQQKNLPSFPATHRRSSLWGADTDNICNKIYEAIVPKYTCQVCSGVHLSFLFMLNSKYMPQSFALFMSYVHVFGTCVTNFLILFHILEFYIYMTNFLFHILEFHIYMTNFLFHILEFYIYMTNFLFHLLEFHIYMTNLLFHILEFYKYLSNLFYVVPSSFVYKYVKRFVRYICVTYL